MSVVANVLSMNNGILALRRTSNIPKVVFQIVRWRKPRWVPRAKTKEFYVRQPTPIDHEEDVELKLRYNHYRSEVKSVRQYIMKSAAATKAQKEDHHEIREQEEKDEWKKILLKNKVWNEEVSIIRETRQAAEEQKKTERLEIMSAVQMEEKLKMMQEAEADVLREKEQSKDFITLENMDTEIEKLLNTRKDHNFAVDKFGNILIKESKKESQHG